MRTRISEENGDDYDDNNDDDMIVQGKYVECKQTKEQTRTKE